MAKAAWLCDSGRHIVSWLVGLVYMTNLNHWGSNNEFHLGHLLERERSSLQKDHSNLFSLWFLFLICWETCEAFCLNWWVVKPVFVWNWFGLCKKRWGMDITTDIENENIARKKLAGIWSFCRSLFCSGSESELQIVSVVVTAQ